MNDLGTDLNHTKPKKPVSQQAPREFSEIDTLDGGRHVSNTNISDLSKKGNAPVASQSISKPPDSFKPPNQPKPPKQTEPPKPSKYRCLLLDPPWDIQQKSGGTKSYGADNHYNLMTLDEIQHLPIPDLLEDNAHVWMWITNAVFPYAFKLLESWGLVYRSPFTWVKSRMGLGVYLRNATESVLLATRGKCPVNFKAQMNWGFFPTQDHSHKPEELYDIIERVSSGPYLELFARRKRHGWDSWGNEVSSDVVIPGYPVPTYSLKALPFVTPKDIAPPEMFELKRKTKSATKSTTVKCKEA